MLVVQGRCFSCRKYSLLNITGVSEDTTCILVDMYQIFGGACCFHLQSKRSLGKGRVGGGMRHLSSKLHGLTFQKAVTFIVAVLTTLNLTLFLSTLFVPNTTTYDYFKDIRKR